ncbi:DinB family protein [Alloacidobacterium sp.]|uniref:DinB family protein n=1 Tax=Alloacidobacterium sp. TaxID=2951999 RepID=UPI002D33D377|nr:DinB family protein [Alloacidobacterium sp.]HYK36328.1 DinB family protein [Alloacidobacterium sp.]
MKMTELFLADLEREAASTRRALERVPEGRDDWKPHEKSMPLGYLTTLVATILGWIDFMVNEDRLDMTPKGDSKYKPQQLKTTRERLDALDESVAKARKALQNTTDEHLLTNWQFVVGGHVASENPRYIMIRDAVFSHLAHHRGQLTVYLRLNEAKVPSIYGPSADENPFG